MKPMARSLDLIVQEVDDEVLIYDEYNARAHCLSADTGRIWLACDGEKSEAAIAAELDTDIDMVQRTLVELNTLALVQIDPALIEKGNGNGATRREFGLKAAKLGGAVAIAPAIYTVIAPTALASATVPNFLCNYYSGQSCDACTAICGCCCCCQGCPKTPNDTSGGSCKMCSSIDFCETADAANLASQDGCLDQLKTVFADPSAVIKCTSGPNCSAKAKADCVGPCLDGVPVFECGNESHDCNCFGTNGNPCDFE
jgi:hypothetical protein